MVKINQQNSIQEKTTCTTNIVLIINVLIDMYDVFCFILCLPDLSYWNNLKLRKNIPNYVYCTFSVKF